MKAYDEIARVRRYNDYIEEHIKNVSKAWYILCERCQNMHPFYDDFLYWEIVGYIEKHDLSKFSKEEFIPYMNYFYGSGKEDFLAAWKHHIEHNPHHWENWTAIKEERFPNEQLCHCVCMVVDWMAMGMVKGDTAEQYYARNKHKIDLPEWAVRFLGDIFERLRG